MAKSKKSAKKGSSKKNTGANAAAKVPSEKKNTVLAAAEAKAEKIVKSSDSADKQKGAKKQNGIVRYFKELKSEFKKVVWPSRKTVVNNTTVVLIAMVISSLVIWGLDSAFVALLDMIIR